MNRLSMVLCVSVLTWAPGRAFSAPFSRCDFTVQDLDLDDWTATFFAYLDEGAADAYVFGEDLVFIAPPETGVALLSEPAGAGDPVFWDARDGQGDREWWGGGATGPDLTLRLRRYGYDPADPPVSIRMTWDLSGAQGRVYVLYDDTNAQVIILRPGSEYVVQVPDTGITLRLRAALPSAADFDRDGDVDQSDFEHFHACATGPELGPPTSSCEDADLDGDDDVDQEDFGVLQVSLSGADVPVE